MIQRRPPRQRQVREEGKQKASARRTAARDYYMHFSPPGEVTHHHLRSVIQSRTAGGNLTSLKPIDSRDRTTLPPRPGNCALGILAQALVVVVWATCWFGIFGIVATLLLFRPSSSLATLFTVPATVSRVRQSIPNTSDTAWSAKGELNSQINLASVPALASGDGAWAPLLATWEWTRQ